MKCTSCRTWGKESEIDFVNRIGTFQGEAPRNVADLPKHVRKYYLELYIIAYGPSPHTHHKAGVEHARLTLKRMGY